MMLSYSMAIFASCGTAIGLRIATRKLVEKSKGPSLIMLNASIAVVACGIGAFANNWFMRMPETKNGIDIIDPENGESMGKSSMCATTAIKQTASTRLLLAIPVCFPSIALFGIERAGMLP